MAAAGGSPAQHQGQSWLNWSEKLGLKSDEESELSEDEKKVKQESGAMRLSREDMTLFGFCPARDDFYLVVCEICGIVVKPQALQRHINVRHGVSFHNANSVINKSKLSNSSVQNSSSHKEKHHNHKKNSLVESKASSRDEKASSKPEQSLHSKQSSPILPSPQQPPPPDPGKRKDDYKRPNDSSKSKNIAENSSKNRRVLQENDKNSRSSPNTKISDSKVKGSTSSHLLSKTKNSSDGSRSKNSSNKALSSSSKSANESSSTNSVNSNKKSKSKNKERKLLLCKDREYDPDKHCGVIMIDSSKPCTRSLTCKTHSLSSRRSVVGRKKVFDELLSDHRAAKEALLKGTQNNQNSSKVTCPSPPKPIQSSSNKVSRPTSLSTSTNQTPKSLSPGPPTLMKQCKPIPPSGATTPTPPSSSSSHKTLTMPNLLSPKDGMNDIVSPDSPLKSFHRSSPLIHDKPESIYKPRCPKPAAMCSFGARRVGLGCYVFNRRQDVFRSVFKALVTDPPQNPPPPKKLCLETTSSSPTVPTLHNDTKNSSDPYSFTCSNSEMINGTKLTLPISNGRLFSPSRLRSPTTANHKLSNSKIRGDDDSDNSCAKLPTNLSPVLQIPSPNNFDTMVNGQAESIHKTTTNVRCSVENNIDRNHRRRLEGGATKILPKPSKNRKPHILAKPHPNTNQNISSTIANVLSGNQVISSAASTNGIDSISPYIHSQFTNSISNNKIFTSHRVISPMNSNQFTTLKGTNKIISDLKPTLNLTNKKINSKTKSISAKPAQFISLSQTLAQDRTNMLACDTSNITYQQVFSNQVLGISHVQLQASGGIQKANVSPNIAPQLKIPFLRTVTTTPPVPSHQSASLFLAAAADNAAPSATPIQQTEFPGSPSLQS